MYTVIRFESATATSIELKAIGEDLNKLRKATFTGFDRVKGRFSCSVCDHNSWVEHVREMMQFLEDFKSVLLDSKAKNVEMEFDVAIEPEDVGGKPYIATDIDPELINKLAATNVGVTFTYYPARTPRPNGNTGGNS